MNNPFSFTPRSTRAATRGVLAPLSPHHNHVKTYKLQRNRRRHVPCLPIRGGGAFSEVVNLSHQAADTIDWTVRCRRSDWLQVASSHAYHYVNKVCKTCARVAGLVVSFIVVVTEVLAPLPVSPSVQCPTLCHFNRRYTVHGNLHAKCNLVSKRRTLPIHPLAFPFTKSPLTTPTDRPTDSPA